MEVYFNRPDVQRALHANVTKLPFPWTGCAALDYSQYAPHLQYSLLSYFWHMTLVSPCAVHSLSPNLQYTLRRY